MGIALVWLMFLTKKDGYRNFAIFLENDEC